MKLYLNSTLGRSWYMEMSYSSNLLTHYLLYQIIYRIINYKGYKES